VTAVSSIPPIPVAPTQSPPQAMPGLSPEHLWQLGEARRRGAKIRRAVSVATFDGWATGLFGALTFICGIFSWIGLVLGAAMLTVAYVEFRGARRLRQLDASAAASLGWNQVALGSALLIYAAYSLWNVFYSHSLVVDQLLNTPELGGMGSIESLARLIGVLIYGTLAAVAIFGQGGTAWYYFSRRKHVEAYLRETPQWILDAQRAGMPM
jgi:hypothetical protein